MQIELNGLLQEELRQFMTELGQPAFRGNQLFTHFHKHRKKDISDVKGFPASLCASVQKQGKVAGAAIVERFPSRKGESIKYAIELDDSQRVEAVFMRYPTHTTLCISTQVGCAMGCAFCASTKEGLFRNITAAEMTAQFYAVEEAVGAPIQNLVLMGIGEPLQNYDHVLQALRILHDPKGKGMSYRNITLSTCGIVPEMLRLAEEDMPINLVISLHAARDPKRQEIMPIAKKYPVAEVLAAADHYFEQTGRRISYEYTMIPGVNDTKEDLDQLVDLLKGKQAHVNLIAYHPIKEYQQQKPDDKALQAFARALHQRGIQTSVRRSIGLEEQGACGQLRAQGARSQDV